MLLSRLRPRVLRLLGALLLAGCSALAGMPALAAGAAGLPPQIPRLPGKPTEVVIIGTRHSAQLEYEEHAPARVRALLNRIAPAAIGVETTPWWYQEDLYFEIAYESYGVAVPWAEEKGKEVRPIDWQARGWELVSVLSWPHVQPGPGPQESAASRDAIPLEAWDMRPLLFADAPAWRDAVHREYAFADPDPNPAGEALRRYMLYRNLMIAREILNLAADYEGEQVVVLIGAAHKPDLDLLLASVPNIVVRHASEWAGVSEAEVEAEERRRDHLAILWYNLAGVRVRPEEVDLVRMEGLLSRLEKESPGDPEVRFLRARWHELSGRPSEALAIDAALAWGEEEWTDRPFTFPDRSMAERMRAWDAREWYELAGVEGGELGAGNTVLSPVAYLTLRQRILYELAKQSVDPAAAARAREELLHASGLNPTQVREVEALLDTVKP